MSNNFDNTGLNPEIIEGEGGITVRGSNHIMIGDGTDLQAPLQPEWFIDPVNGSDSPSHDGSTLAEALKTHEEFRKRIGKQVINIPMTINLVGDFSADFPVRVWFDLGRLGQLKYVGTATSLGTGSFTAVTVINRAANQPWEITDAALPVSWSASGFLNTATSGPKRVRITGGPGAPGNTNSVAWTVKEPVAKTARISPFTAADGTISGSSPQVGDTYIVESLSNIQDLSVDVRVSSIFQVSSANPLPAVIFQNISLPFTNTVRPSARCNNPSPEQGVVRFFGCEVGMLQYANPGVLTISGCKTGGQGAIVQPTGYSAFYLSSAIFQNIGVEGGVATFDLDTIMQDAGAGASGIQVRGSGMARFGTCGIFDHPGPNDAVEIRPGGIGESRIQLAGVTLLYGSGNVGFGIRVRSCAQFVYVATKPIVTGAAGDTNIAGVVTAYGLIPSTNAAELAAIRAQL